MVERLALLPGRRARREIVEMRLPPAARVEDAAADAEVAEHGVALTGHTLARVKIERELQREELELEADRIKGHADLAGMRAEADTRMALLEAARLNPELTAGDTVRARRKELGLSQVGLADRAGVSVKKVSDVEAGRGGVDRDLRHIARVLDLDYQPALFLRPDREPLALPRSVAAEIAREGDAEVAYAIVFRLEAFGAAT